MPPAELLNLLDQNKCVCVGIEPDTHRMHRVLFSIDDDTHFVAIQDGKDGEVITVLPLDYHENLAWKIGKKALNRALWILDRKLHKTKVLGQPSITTPKYNVLCFYYKTDGTRHKKTMGIWRPTDGAVEDSSVTPDDVLARLLVEKLSKLAVPFDDIDAILLENCVTHEAYPCDIKLFQTVTTDEYNA